MTIVRLKPRKLSYGGGLPLNPLGQQQQNSQISQQLGQAVPQIMQLAGSSGAAGAAGIASAAVPVGLAVAGGQLVNGLVKNATTDADGFAKTNVGARVARVLGDQVDPIGRITTGISNLGRGDLSVAEKIGGFLPGVGALVTDRADEVKKAELLRRKNQQAVNESEGNIYGGAAVMAKDGIRLLPRPVAAESTGVARPQQPKPVLTVDDVRDPGARTFLKARSYPDGKHFYQNRLLLDQYSQNGSPAIVENPTLERAHFAHQANTMHIQPNNDDSYLAELAHGQQRQRMGWPLMNLKKAFVDNRYADSSVPGQGRYAVAGTLEHEAHSVIEPQLQQQYGNIGRDGYRMQNALKQALPGSFPQHVVKQELRLTPRKLAIGGSLIASGALHSEKHGIEGQGIGRTGIPVMNTLTGERAAEIERNELVLGDRATASLERLRERHQRGDKLAAGMAGKLLKVELRENTQPNKRYERRLQPKSVQQYEGGGNLELLGKDGKPLAGFSGNNRVVSQKHTLKLVTHALGAKNAGHEHKLGKLAFKILDEQDKKPIVHAKN